MKQHIQLHPATAAWKSSSSHSSATEQPGWMGWLQFQRFTWTHCPLFHRNRKGVRMTPHQRAPVPWTEAAAGISPWIPGETHKISSRTLQSLLAAVHLHNKLSTFYDSIFIKSLLFCFLTSIPVTVWPLQMFLLCSALELVHVVVSSCSVLSTLQSTHYLKNNISSQHIYTTIL